MSKRVAGGEVARDGAAKRKKYEQELVKPREVPVRAPARKMTELKNPRDVSLELGVAHDLGVTIDTTREAFATAGDRLREHATANTLLPERAQQTRALLTLGANRGLPSGTIEDAPPDDLYAQLIRVNRRLYEERNAAPQPLEALAAHGLLSPHLQSLDARQERMADELEASADFIAEQLRQLTRGTALPPPPPQTAPTEEASATQPGGSSVKLSLLFGTMNYVFGYERRASNTDRKQLFAAHDADQAQRRARFFADDPLDETTPCGAPPAAFKLFRQLRAQHAARFAGRDAALRDASRLVPKSDLELVARTHITRFRQRPRAGQQRCFNGTRCLFATFSREPAAQYVGAAFFTPRQLAAGGAEGADALCIDCLLKKWTLQWMDNIAKSVQQKSPINHFGVLVGDGEYAHACMMDCVKNHLPTGIVGCVPRYDPRWRQVVAASGATEAHIGEVGMDF